MAAWLDQSKLLVRNPRKPKKIATKPPKSSATPNAMRRPDGCFGDGRELGSTKRVVSVGCFGEAVSMSSDLRALTRNRLQRAIYFCLHRGSLPETLQQVNRDSGAKSPAPTNSVKKYMSDKIAGSGFIDWLGELCSINLRSRETIRLWARSGCWARSSYRR